MKLVVSCEVILFLWLFFFDKKMFAKKVTILLVLCFACHLTMTNGAIKLITNLLRNNVVGQPVIHQTQKWPFHPEEGSRRNPEFEALNGHHAYYLIERLGLGTDGRQAERKYQQTIRDLGVPTTSYDNAQNLQNLQIY